MAADGWRYVKADEKTDEAIAELVEKLSETAGVRLSRGQVMSRSMALGVELLLDDPERFTSERPAKKSSR